MRKEPQIADLRESPGINSLQEVSESPEISVASTTNLIKHVIRDGLY